MRIDTVLLIFNRPEHTRKVLASLRENEVSRVHAYLDKSNRKDVILNQKYIKEIVSEFRDDSFRVELYERATPHGLAANIRSAINERFENGADAVIVFEDDCVLRRGGYQFFIEGLKELKNTKRVRSLCGYTPTHCGFISEPDSDVILLSRFLTWGWATWKDRWLQYEPNLRVLVESAQSLSIDINDFADDLGRYCSSPKFLDGEVGIWSINWILLHYLTSTFAAYPIESVIDNIGMDGSGSNCNENMAFHNPGSNELALSYKWTDLKFYPENEDIMRDFMSENSHLIYPCVDS